MHARVPVHGILVRCTYTSKAAGTTPDATAGTAHTYHMAPM